MNIVTRTEAQPRILYFYEGDRPRGCLAYTLAATPAEVQQAGAADISYATSLCHPNDQFVKAVGRAKAVGRTKSARYLKTMRIQAPIAFAAEPGSGRWWREFEQAIREEVTGLGREPEMLGELVVDNGGW